MSVTKYEWYVIWKNDSLYVAIQNPWTKANGLCLYMTVDVRIESEGKNFILIKSGIVKIEGCKIMLEDFGIEKIKGLNKRNIESVKKYAIGLVKSKHGPENGSCPLYQKGCNNMLCPMLSNLGIWYSEEDVCRNPRYKDDIVVINQKKLKKRNPGGYFTRDMLSKKFIIRSGISGIDPDVPPSIDARGQAAVDGLYIKREKLWNTAHQKISKRTMKKQKTIVIKLANNLRKIQVVIEIWR
jgi:hypothetical protein